VAKKAKPPEGSDGKETTAGYFRKVFEESPDLLNERSNKALLKRWLADHPGETEVPRSVKVNLANIKGVLRSKQRSKVAARAQKKLAPGENRKVATVPTGDTQLDLLEYQIDECMILAKTMGRDDMESIVSHLRRARKEVVWKIGK